MAHDLFLASFSTALSLNVSTSSPFVVSLVPANGSGTTNPAGMAHLFQTYPADLMELYLVSPLVNSVKNDSAALVALIQNATTLDLVANPRLLLLQET